MTSRHAVIDPTPALAREVPLVPVGGSGDMVERRRYLDGLITRARLAAAAFSQFSQEQVDKIVRAMVLAGLDAAQTLAALAVAETKIGLLEDKAIKNMVATEFVYHSIKDERTVGVIREYPERNLKEIAEPVGVVLGVTPITNPTSTVLFKSLMIAKTRNTIVFCPHPMAAGCSNEAARIMAEAARAAGAPEGMIGWVEGITQHDTRYLMKHADVALVDATGGPSMVAAAYSSGKPALGVGAGNVPCYIHRSADLRMAVVDILTSKTFDNGTICASEQTLLVDRPIYERTVALFAELGAHVCTPEEVDLLERALINPAIGRVQRTAVGQSAETIANVVGIAVAPETKLLLAPLRGVGRSHPLSCEKLFPVLGIVAVDGEDAAINAAMDVLYFGGVGHTASIFCEDEAVTTRYGEALNAGRIIVNSPSSVGALGGVYNDLTPTFSFGCGTGGGNSTSAPGTTGRRACASPSASRPHSLQRARRREPPRSCTPSRPRCPSSRRSTRMRSPSRPRASCSRTCRSPTATATTWTRAPRCTTPRASPASPSPMRSSA